MSLIKGVQYKVVSTHPFHANRIGYFEFFGKTDQNVIVLSDFNNPHHLFIVESLNDLIGKPTPVSCYLREYTLDDRRS